MLHYCVRATALSAVPCAVVQHRVPCCTHVCLRCSALCCVTQRCALLHCSVPCRSAACDAATLCSILRRRRPRFTAVRQCTVVYPLPPDAAAGNRFRNSTASPRLPQARPSPREVQCCGSSATPNNTE